MSSSILHDRWLKPLRRALKALLHQVGNRLRLLGKVSLGRAVSAALTFAAFLVVTVFPVSQRGHFDLATAAGWGQMLRLAWPLFVAAFYLKYKDPFVRLFQGDREKRVAWKTRKLRWALVLQRIEQRTPRNPADLLRMRTEILCCAASAVSELLDLPREGFSANLLGFSRPDFSEMEVLARSEPHRFVSGAKHAVTPVFGPWVAIKRSQVRIEDDVRNDRRWAGGPKPPYRSILIIPIVRSNQALGVLTIDCVQPYAFHAQGLNLEILVQPYVALLSGTFGPNSLGVECDYTPPRH